MSVTRMDLRGVKIGPVYAAPRSVRYHIRKRRLARVRGWVLRSLLPCLVCCAVVLGILWLILVVVPS